MTNSFRYPNQLRDSFSVSRSSFTFRALGWGLLLLHGAWMAGGEFWHWLHHRCEASTPLTVGDCGGCCHCEVAAISENAGNEPANPSDSLALRTADNPDELKFVSTRACCSSDCQVWRVLNQSINLATLGDLGHSLAISRLEPSRLVPQKQNLFAGWADKRGPPSSHC